MDLVLLTETIIKKIVADPETVSVKSFPSEDENEMQIEVLISSDDMGRVLLLRTESLPSTNRITFLNMEKGYIYMHRLQILRVTRYIVKDFKLLLVVRKPNMTS